MKKIENIIDNCIDCRFAERYNHPNVCRCAAFICTRMNPQRLAGFDAASGIIQVPDWCPLETYTEHGQQQPVSPAFDPRTVGLCGLEWMAENLSGHGGTKIDGRTYYTWEEAMAAAEQLGDGWRLPTEEEFERICDLGSKWLDDGPHGLPGRLFGDGLFLEAAGYRHESSGALTYVGTEGLYWSSSSNAAGNVYAGYLHFNSGSVYPLRGSYRAHGFSVRCVRNVK